MNAQRPAVQNFARFNAQDAKHDHDWKNDRDRTANELAGIFRAIRGREAGESTDCDLQAEGQQQRSDDKYQGRDT